MAREELCTKRSDEITTALVCADGEDNSDRSTGNILVL